MRGRVLVLVLVLLGLLVLGGEGRGEGNAVRLCGRDFVRAVVFTCGGSRWKRHLRAEHPLPASNTDATESTDPLPFPPQNNAYPDSWSYRHQGLETESQETHSSEEPEPERALGGSRKAPVLAKREAAKLLTTSCCSLGCTEREISSLC
ncbi:insulin-like peptide INSL5 [Phaethornis superciliosus]